MGSEAPTRLESERLAKLERLRARGEEPYPWEYPGRASAAAVRKLLESTAPGTDAFGGPRRVAGRLRSIREHGTGSFADLEDQSGRIQLFLQSEVLGEARYRDLLADLDPGDLVGAEGVPMLTKRGEPSLRPTTVTLLAKAIHPPPEKRRGLRDPEARLRRRYAELLSSAESRQRFIARSVLTREIRAFFWEEEFLEVETPVLLPIAGGAAAEPFRTRSRYLDEEIQLRISLELPLKRLLVGGLERVFELGHVFRNEDLDSTHSPEFTMLEAYWAYADYTDMRRLIERLYSRLAGVVADRFPEMPGAAKVRDRFRPPFASVDFVEALERKSGVDGIAEKSKEELTRLAHLQKLTVRPDASPGTLLDKLFDRFVGPTLVRPTFVLDHPASTTPLAKRHRSKPGRVERFELYCEGVELGNAYTELNDPLEQEIRFQTQLAVRGEDRYAYDADFVEALRYGMPPATGVGIGIDRAVMFLLGLDSIKDAILFPPTRTAEPAESAPTGNELG